MSLRVVVLVRLSYLQLVGLERRVAVGSGTVSAGAPSGSMETDE